MATHSSNLAWEVPWTEEPGGLQSMGLQSLKILCLLPIYISSLLFNYLLKISRMFFFP